MKRPLRGKNGKGHGRTDVQLLTPKGYKTVLKCKTWEEALEALEVIIERCSDV